jgi:hypothetical protein
LDSIEFPESLQVIGKSLFDGCSSLTTVNVPSSVKEIRNHAFECCQSLVEVQLSEGLERICKKHFSGAVT